MHFSRPPLCLAAFAASLFVFSFASGAADVKAEPSAAASPAASASPSPSPSLMTPEKQHELFDALDLSSDALKPVAAAVAKGDYPAADHALAEYFRHRTSVPWTFDPHNVQRVPSFHDRVADDALNGRLQGGLVLYWHTFPGNKVDWFYNETLVAPGAAKNSEWQWQLCRMGFWGNLAAAYRATGDEKYTRAWLDQVRSFIAQCPAPNRKANDTPSAWRTIEAGIRMSGAWPTAWFSFLLSPQFTDEDIALYADACLSHARYLKQFNTGGNWLTMEMSGLYTTGAVFPEFKEAGAWREYAVNRMHAEETAQFLPDGAQYELSTMYHNVAMDNLIGIARVAKLTGREKELPADYIANLQKAFDYELYLMTPARNLPEFNDSTAWSNTVMRRCGEAAEFFPGRSDYQWIATDGTMGHPPTGTSHAFPWAGFYVMRTGWERDANYFVLRAGPLGAGHAHQDKLNVILWAYGRLVLFNSGGASYERSIWRDYSTNTFSKNTVLVDGKPQYRDPKDRNTTVSKAPIDARWESTPDHDFAVGVYSDGYGGLNARIATHTRRVLFVKPDIFIIADTLAPHDAAVHTYQARWNLLSTRTQEDATTHAVTTMDLNKPNMTLVPLQPDLLEVRSASAQTTPELLGWYVRKDMNPPRVPATTVLHTKKGAGIQSFLTLLVPMRSGAVSPIKSVTPVAPDSATVTLNDGRVFSIVADPDPSGSIKAVEISHRTNVAVSGSN